MFEGFERRRVDGDGVAINLVIGGDGPPVLLLHGYPQTHAMWHRVAPELSRAFTVVCPDLRGYGDSDKPAGDPEHATYSKRANGNDQVAVMRRLGFERFALIGHDRGGRVAHRLCLDHPDAVSRVAVLDIVPTHRIFASTTKRIALSYYHWYFLAQPAPLPERLIEGDAQFYLEWMLGNWGSGLGIFAPEALAEYRRCFADPATIHASCEDYRAAASIDLRHDEADMDRKVDCPLLALWGQKGVMERNFDVAATWRERASDVRGQAIDAGHFLAEEQPEATTAALRDFLGEGR
jgi:haloacetate dehalogenase